MSEQGQGSTLVRRENDPLRHMCIRIDVLNEYVDVQNVHTTVYSHSFPLSNIKLQEPGLLRYFHRVIKGELRDSISY